mgnify:CR=1 FL=1
MQSTDESPGFITSHDESSLLDRLLFRGWLQVIWNTVVAMIVATIETVIGVVVVLATDGVDLLKQNTPLQQPLDSPGTNSTVATSSSA